MMVAFTEDALRDLEEIADFIAIDDPRRAESFVAELEKKCRDIANFPASFPVLETHARFQIRKRSYRSYLIFFRVLPAKVEIIRVLHGARDYAALLDT